MIEARQTDDAVGSFSPVMFVLLATAAGPWHRHPATQTFLRLCWEDLVVGPDGDYAGTLLLAKFGKHEKAPVPRVLSSLQCVSRCRRIHVTSRCDVCLSFGSAYCEPIRVLTQVDASGNRLQSWVHRRLTDPLVTSAKADQIQDVLFLDLIRLSGAAEGSVTKADSQMYREFRYFAETSTRGPLGFMTDAEVSVEVLQSRLPEYPHQVRLRPVRHVREFVPSKTFALRVLGIKDLASLSDLSRRDAV